MLNFCNFPVLVNHGPPGQCMGADPGSLGMIFGQMGGGGRGVTLGID